MFDIQPLMFILGSTLKGAKHYPYRSTDKLGVFTEKLI